MNFLKNIYNWTLKKAEHKNAKWYLGFISFAESSFFPIPPDILLIPMALASKAKALFYAFICTTLFCSWWNSWICNRIFFITH